MSIFVHVLLPLRLSRPFTYHFDEATSLKRGQRVVVPFGKRKRYTGIVWSASVDKPPYETKAIEGVFDDEPVLTEIQLNLWEWLAAHYMTSLGEVMRTAMVSGLLIEDELSAFDSEHSSSEVMLQKALPKNESWIELVDGETAWRFVEDSKAVKQVELVKGLLELIGPDKPIPWRELQEVTRSTVAVRNALVKKGMLLLSERPIERLKPSAASSARPVVTAQT